MREKVEKGAGKSRPLLLSDLIGVSIPRVSRDYEARREYAPADQCDPRLRGFSFVIHLKSLYSPCAHFWWSGRSRHSRRHF